MKKFILFFVMFFSALAIFAQQKNVNDSTLVESVALYSTQTSHFQWDVIYFRKEGNNVIRDDGNYISGAVTRTADGWLLDFKSETNKAIKRFGKYRAFYVKKGDELKAFMRFAYKDEYDVVVEERK